MRFRRKSIAGLALAVASITALAACSSSRYRSGGPANGVKVPGGIGRCPWPRRAARRGQGPSPGRWSRVPPGLDPPGGAFGLQLTGTGKAVR